MFDNAKLVPLTMEQGIVLSIMTGVGLAPVKEVIKDVSYRLGRIVETKEFLNEEFVKELQGLYFPDFTKMMVPTPIQVEEKRIILPEGVK